MLATLHRHRATLIYAPPMLATLALLWLAREQPLTYGPLRLDGLSLFFLLLAIATPLLRRDATARTALATALTTLAIGTTATPIIALALALACAILLPHTAGRLPLFGAMAALLLGYGLLVARGALWYDGPSAGAALDSLAFWFVLLAATLPLWPLGAGQASANNRFIFLYPLVRLYTLGPWNPGWALATALFGGALALWHAWAAFRYHDSSARVTATLSALALASFGLASSAGIAAGCYAMLAGVVVGCTQPAHMRQEAGTPLRTIMRLALLLVAVWSAVGAAISGGLATLAGVAWAAGLLATLALILHNRQVNWPLAWLHGALAVFAPLVVAGLIAPTVAQLQAGLTPYGDVLIWPWVGMAFVNSAQTPVAVLPSIVVATLMSVLVALLSLLSQLRAAYQKPATQLDLEEALPDQRWWQLLRDEVPWLGRGRNREPE
ncbi:MAG: hypothetical protein H7Z42_08615 [Roseiflexaceae bacterium]|nr:hypothetical protein [Roseiflexaceae bacterium]